MAAPEETIAEILRVVDLTGVGANALLGEEPAPGAARPGRLRDHRDLVRSGRRADP